MSAIPILNQQGQAVGELQVPEALKAPPSASEALVQAVVTIRANGRAGTACTKNKGEVAGHGKKPWRQKGTGRARAGYRRSPIWRGGGVVFGPKPRSYAKALPRKQARLALRKAVWDKFAAGEVRVLDSLVLDKPKTGELAGILRNLKADRGALVVIESVSRELALAARNLPRVEVARPGDVNALQVLKYPLLVITRAGLERLQERLTDREAST
ncbi:MAG: 50S ribosomal protein L4 [Kiritimatiellae bacterium]|nr:50S ribosomal protein L4 [Kiritimatiellia bacterium]MDW8457511.1 50S ribosomal protein L4 [Verrucomicrobiota bacterium]